MDKGTALGSGVACGRHHAVSSCESPSFASVFSPPQEKSQAQRIVPRKGRWPEAPADPPPAVNDGSSVVGGSPPQGAQDAKTQVGHRPVRESQGSVSFIPLGTDIVGQVLKQSCGLRLWAGMLQERASP